MKKIKLYFLTITFFIILIVCTKVNAVGNVSLTANKNTLKIGDEFTVSVNLSGVEVATLTSKITIDTSKVQYLSGPANSNFSNRKSNLCLDRPNRR